jgi:hypothetical protein
MATIVSDKTMVNNLSTSTSLKRDVSNRVYSLKPVTPFTMFLSKLKKDKLSGSYKHEWFNQDKRPRHLTVNGALTAADTTLTVDTPGGSYCQAGTLIQIPATGEIVQVSAKLSATKLTITRSYTSTAAGAIADNALIKLLPDAAAEGGGILDQIHLMEEAQYNYLQKMRTPIELTRRAARMETYVGEYRSRLRAIKAVEHAEFKENAFLFGERYNDTTNKVTLLGGILWYIKTFTNETRTWNASTVSAGVLTYQQFVDGAAENIFKYGSRNKFMMAGSNMISAINVWYGGKLRIEPNAKVYGLPMVNLLVPFGDGTLATAFQPAFSGPTHKTYVCVVDLDYVAEVPGEALHLEKDVGLKSNHIFQDEWVEDVTLRVGNPSTHFLVYGLNGGDA